MDRLPVSRNILSLNINYTKPRIQDEGYFQIIHLSPEGVATLKPSTPSSRDANEEPVRTFDLDSKRDEDDLKFIRAGLMRGDHQVFSTIVKVMGKEVMGNVRVVPKDPPILKMPDLVMDKIFSFLSRRDLLKLRLVNSRWTKALPFQNFLTSLALNLALPSGLFDNWRPPVKLTDKQYYWDDKSSKPMLKMYPRPIIEGDGALVEVLPLPLLQEVEDLFIISQGDYPPFPGSIILQNCPQIRKFKYAEWNGPFGFHGNYWNFLKTFIAKYGGQLEHIKIYAGRCNEGESENYLDLQELLENASGRLEKLWLFLSERNSLRNLESLKGRSITSIRISGLSVALTKSQILWISTNLPNLRRALLQVNHTHSSDPDTPPPTEDDEVDGETIVEMITNLQNLQQVYLVLGVVQWAQGNFSVTRGYCSKFEGIKDHIKKGARGWHVINWRTKLSRTFSSWFWRPEHQNKDLEILVGTKRKRNSEK